MEVPQFSKIIRQKKSHRQKKRAVMLTKEYCERLMAVPVAAQCIIVK